ncbi:MAG: hypothetical protein HY241_15525 [Actinobacteria bacterium]|nr:hypothetical protein [Actinomycetota bacterium]
MLAELVDVVRLSLHVLAATVWVGGQITLAALVPALRAVSDAAPRAAARRFTPVAWTAYVILVLTGAWNVVVEQPDATSAWNTALVVKVGVVAASGTTAFLHGRARSTAGLAIYGALSGLTALAAVVVGVLLAG